MACMFGKRLSSRRDCVSVIPVSLHTATAQRIVEAGFTKNRDKNEQLKSNRPVPLVVPIKQATARAIACLIPK